jgi:hypothetical protein
MFVYTILFSEMQVLECVNCQDGGQRMILLGGGGERCQQYHEYRRCSVEEEGSQNM